MTNYVCIIFLLFASSYAYNINVEYDQRVSLTNGLEIIPASSARVFLISPNITASLSLTLQTISPVGTATCEIHYNDTGNVFVFDLFKTTDSSARMVWLETGEKGAVII